MSACEPSEWAMKRARAIYSDLCDDTSDDRPEDMETALIRDVARILDAARAEGRREGIDLALDTVGPIAGETDIGEWWDGYRAGATDAIGRIRTLATP